jgi:hypothetical protein
LLAVDCLQEAFLPLDLGMEHGRGQKQID